MKYKIFLSVLISLLFTLSPINNAFAQDVPDAYLVKDVTVDIISDSAVNARNKAFEMAQEKAFSILAERFKTVEKFSVDKLPNSRILSSLVQDFEITNEQTSTKRYIATFDFRFRVDAVINYFGHSPTNYDPNTIKNKNNNILLLPFFGRGELMTIWGKNTNPIFIALSLKLPEKSNIILPNDDISDHNDIRDSNPYTLTSTTLKKLKARYKVSDVVLMVGEVNKSAPNTLKVTLMRTDRGSIEPISVNSFEETIPFQQNQENVFIKSANQVLIELSGEWKKSETSIDDIKQETKYYDENITKPSSVTTDLQNAVRNKYNINKQSNKEIVRDVRPPVNEVTINQNTDETVFIVNFTNISQWLDMQKQLQQTPEIVQIEMISMKTNMAEISVTYTDWEKLEQSLIKRGFAVQKIDNGYNIKRSGGVF